jgi:hypothetical protein
LTKRPNFSTTIFLHRSPSHKIRQQNNEDKNRERFDLHFSSLKAKFVYHLTQKDDATKRSSHTRLLRFFGGQTKNCQKNLQKQNISFTFVSVTDITGSNITRQTTEKPL